MVQGVSIIHSRTDKANTLDRIRDWRLNPLESKRFSTELYALIELRQGLDWLAAWLGSLENTMPEMLKKMLACSSIPLPTNPPEAVLECMFHWYSVTHSNFVGLTSRIAQDLGYLNDEESRRYRKEVGGNVLTFRNKVGAHFARFYAASDDTPNDVLGSIWPHLSLSRGRIFVQVPSGATNHDVSWTLTITHEQFMKRYPIGGEQDHPPEITPPSTTASA